MSLILNIDTAEKTASVCIARDGNTVQFAENEDQKDHALWLHIAISKLMRQEKTSFSELNAVAVSIGPGSYTGLRVGLSAAKGLCFALNIPLITVGTLEMMAFAAKDEPVDLLCPMIDARRLEVFTAIFDMEMAIVMKPQALIVAANSFEQFYLKNKSLFFGSGSKKMQSLIPDKLWPKTVIFKEIIINASCMTLYSYNKLSSNTFANLVNSEPSYLKEFYTNTPKIS